MDDPVLVRRLQRLGDLARDGEGLLEDARRVTTRSTIRGANQRNGFPLVPAIDSKVLAIDGDDAVPRVQLTHANQTQVREVRFAIGIPFR